MNRRMAANPAYGHGSNFGAIDIPEVTPVTAVTLALTLGVVGAVGGGLFLNDAAQVAAFRNKFGARGGVTAGAVAGVGVGLLLAGTRFISQQG